MVVLSRYVNTRGRRTRIVKSQTQRNNSCPVCYNIIPITTQWLNERLCPCYGDIFKFAIVSLRWNELARKLLKVHLFECEVI